MLQLSKIADLDIQLIDGDRGENYPSRDEFYENEYCLFLDANNITSNGFDFSTTHFITKEKDSKLRNGKLQRNDIVIMTRGSVGNIAFYDNSIMYSNIRINSGMLIIRCGKSISPLNVYYQFKSPIVLKQINDFMSGSVQKQLPVSILKEIKIFTCSKNNANFLKLIDDKIALNNKTNTELENMAKTIYDYWFTQFDFPDKNGHPYKTSGGQVVYNEILKREIPAGWEVKNILDCCKVIDCLHSKKPDYCYEDENCYLLQLENLIDLKLIDLTNKYYVSKKDYETWTSKTKVKQGDLVVTNAGRVGGVSRIPNYIETGIGRNMTSIRPITISEYLLCYFFSSSDCDKQIRQNTDQGAFFQSLNVKGIKKLNLTIPPKEIQDKFDSLVGKMRLQIESNHKENEELTKLRDYLLPLLMNGQIEVK